MLHKMKWIGFVLLACPASLAVAQAPGPNYDIRPNGCPDGSCRPSPGWGYTETNWREWPFQARPDRDFPSSVGRRVLPTPAGKIEKPLPEAPLVPPKPQIPSDDTQRATPAVPGSGTGGGTQGTGAGPAVPGASVPGISVPNTILPGAGSLETPKAPGTILPGTGEPGTIAVPKTDSNSILPLGPTTSGKQPGESFPGLTRPNTGAIDKSPAPMPDQLPGKSPQPIPGSDSPAIPSTPGVLPGGSAPKPSDRSALEVAPTEPLLGPALELQPTSVAAVAPATTTIRADWTMALQETPVAKDSLQQTSFSEKASTPAVKAKPWAISGYSPVQLCESEHWLRGDAKISCDYHGHTYLFTSEAERRKFVSNPQKYTPGFNGNDPVLAHDHQFQPGSVQHSALWNGRLYLFASSDTLRRFRKQPGVYAAE